MPAFNAEKTVKDTFNEIPKHLRKHIILVDDNSKDNTVSVSNKLGIKVFKHSNNLGYGGNQKTCYWEALKLNPDVVIMLHPDYQYDATLLDDLIKPILDGRYDYMFGSRIANKKGAIEGGMPLIKYYVNRIVCLIQNILLGVNFTEHFSGLRAYSGKLLKEIPFQRFSNDFVFDQEMTISAISYGFRIGEISIPTRYHEEASSIKYLKGIKFILEGFLAIVRYKLNKLIIIASIIISIIFVRDLLSSRTYKLSALEIDRNIRRQEYLGNGLNKIYKNRVGLYYFNTFYPKAMKFETRFLYDLSYEFIFIPIILLTIYLGYIKFNEK